MPRLKKIKVHIFLRKPFKFENHSIEKLFHSIIKKKNDEFKFILLECPFYSSGFLKRFYNCVWAFFKQGDINHVSGDTNFISIFLDKNKTINTFHDCYNLRHYTGLKKIIFKLFWFYIPIKRSRYITAVSDFTKRELKELLNTNKEIKVIPNFLTENHYIKKKFKNKNCALVIGTTKNKNIDKIFLAVKKTIFELLIVGKLNCKQKNFLLKNNIKYKNFINISEKKIIELYNKSFVLVNPSLYEGFGLTNLEAQKMGIPVITSNISPMKEIMGDSAILVNPNDEHEIYRNINKIHRDKLLRNKIIIKGYKNILDYDINFAKKKYFDLYRKMLNEK
ncbi:glycosyltransferase [Candidatus Pelagibacter ubique]|jgi:glycosyltransferase involved in cell wall biosynthesis|nr:glycosyltransferase [Candidatus Pelagibacter ubique]